MIDANLFIVSAPSGAGKTSLVRQLIKEAGNLALSVSHTTRQIRPGEVNGRDYFFVSSEEFRRLIDQGELLEHALVFDNYYGTARQTVEQNLKNNIDTILEIDWQGAQQIKKLRPGSISIFILPPSTEVLEKRLQARGQDNAQVIARRMKDAVTEISHYHEFDYILVNEDFNLALNELKSIVIANRLTNKRQKDQLKLLINQLIS